MRLTVASVAICFIMLLSLVNVESVAATADAYESDDSSVYASIISTDGAIQSHTIDPSGDVDYVKFSATSGVEYTIETSLGTASDTYIYLYDTDGTTPLDYDDDSGEGYASKIIWTCPSSGTYYVKIEHYYSTGTGSYFISVTAEAVAVDIYEPDDLTTTATTLSTDGTAQSHTIDPSGDVDYVKFSASAGTEYTIETTLGTCSDTYIYLYDTNGTVLDYDDDSGAGYASQIIWTCPSSGTYYVKIRHYNTTGTGSYTISVTSEMVGPTADEYEPDDTVLAANRISTDGADQSHTIYPAGDVDYVKFDATAGTEYTIETTLGTCSDTYICLYDTNGTTIIDYDDDSGAGYASQIIWTCPSSGTYYVKIRHYNTTGTGSYDVNIFAVSPTTQNDMYTGTDAGDSFSEANALITPASGTGYVDSEDLDDYYKISVSSGQTISAELIPPYGYDFDLYVYDTSQSEIGSSTFGGSQTDSVEVTAATSGDYYIKVHRYNGSGIYSLTILVAGVGALQDDMGSGTDAGDSISAATTIQAGPGTGYLDDIDLADYYKVNVSAGQTIDVELTPPSGSDFDLTLYDSSQSYVDSSAYGGSQTDSVTGTATSSGYFYIYVEQWSGSGIYSMTVTITGGTAQDDMDTGTDAGNTISAATTIPAGSGTGYVDSTDIADYYKVSVSSGQTVSVSMTPPSGSDFDIKLYDTSQSQIYSSNYGGSQTDTVEGTATASGYFYIHVYRYSGQGIYSMTVTATGGTAQNDWNSGQDAGNSSAQAMMISTGTGTGYVDETDTDDYYKIQVGSVGVTISATLAPTSGSDFDLYLYSPNNTEVDSSLLSGSQTDTVSYETTSAGVHYVRVHRYSGSGTYSLNVSVTSAGVEAESAHPYANNFDRTWTINGGAGTENMRIRFSQLDAESDYDYVYIYDENYDLIETYTGSYRNQWTPWVAGSRIRVRLKTDGSIDGYGFTVDNLQTAALAPVTPSNKYAIIVGINQYTNIRDLSYAVNDANDWRNYLRGEGYTISRFITDGQATEDNIKAAIASVVARADANDTIAFVFSGHGAKSSEVGLAAGNSVICATNSANGTTGNMTDAEFDNAFSGFSGRLFIFLDSCRSGGMNEVINNAGANMSNRFMTTTCRDNGLGWDVGQLDSGDWVRNGAWTYWYLERALIGRGYTTAEQAYNWAGPLYPPWGVQEITGYVNNRDDPLRYDGDELDGVGANDDFTI